MSKKRLIVGIVAVYAVMLQAFVISAFPVAVVDSFGGIVCLQEIGVPGAPAKDLHRHHGVCCILACAASSFAVVVTAGGLVVFPELLVSPFVFGKEEAWSVRSPLKFYFAARGPPLQSF
ncbi:MAG: hypothetical protein ACLP4V_06305 [Methylocella sp.]